MAPVMSEMAWGASEGSKDKERDKVVRLGYLRYGEKAPVMPEAHRKSNCPEGWYELLAGGFVCGKHATLDLEHPRFKHAKAPDRDGPLPYTYGVNASNGTPLYRQVPSHEERMKLEPWIAKAAAEAAARKKAKEAKDKGADDSPYATASVNATSSAACIDCGRSPSGHATDAGAESAAIGDSAGDSKPDTPWYLKDAPDGGPPPITLSDLQETDGPIARRMVKGFFLSLDHQFGAGGATWWKTIGGLVAPAERVYATKPATEFHGVWLGKDAGTFATKNGVARRIDKLPVGFALVHAKKYALDEKRRHAAATGESVDRFAAVGLTGETAAVGGTDYWQTDEGWWMRAADGTKTEPGPAPDRLGESEKWIDVNLRRQTLVAFEGDRPVFATIVSSGRKDHDTPPGSFRIREKHIAATMDGDADTATDGPYSIEDVPYIEYFNAGYALHGAFWHAELGRIKSHGCVNMAPWDSKAIFRWTDPQLPEGWHAVFATKEHPGTRVVVHERAPGT